MGWKSWNDRLSLVLIVLIIGLWVGQGYLPAGIPDSVNGALIAVFTLIAQFYFRKKPDEEDSTTA
jgi:hypothetical protein